MFVPKSLYESAPYYWIVLGIVLIIMGVYLGATGNLTYSLAGIGGGAISCIWGLLVFQRRLANDARKPCTTYDDYLDQTCELNLRETPVAEPAPGQPQD